MLLDALDLGVRPAGPQDNDGLVALAAACPMHAEVSVCVRRDPDFFALSRLEGERWTVGVVDGPDGEPVGCIAAAERIAWVRGTPTRTGYVCDLKVHPLHRGRGVADALVRYARAACAELGEDIPCLLTALAGNRAVERRVEGPRGAPALTPFAVVRSWSVPLLWGRDARPPADLVVRRAGDGDAEEMAELWRAVAPGRQFAPVLDTEDFGTSAAGAPAPDIGSYWIARRRRGSNRLAGFVALWDRSGFKATHVLRYSLRAGAFRRAFNAAALLLGAPRLPPAGAALRYATAFHLCVPMDEPATLRALLFAARAELRRAGYPLLAVGLDRRDPLARALAGLGAFGTDIRAYVTTPGGRYTGPPLDDRPLHFETALV